MKVDFFQSKCQKKVSASLFGICDDYNIEPAYVSISKSDKWIASVTNQHKKEVNFIAVDHCIEITRPDGKMESRCDAMLSYDKNIVFVELKDKRKDWSNGFDQIEQTLICFIENHGSFYWRQQRRRAFLANKSHPNFHVTSNEQDRKFYSRYKIRLNIEATIEI
jgi:hypothetical protein